MISDVLEKPPEEVVFIIPPSIAEWMMEEWGGIPSYFHVVDRLPLNDSVEA